MEKYSTFEDLKNSDNNKKKNSDKNSSEKELKDFIDLLRKNKVNKERR